ncbi:hypothetical protein H6F46_13550 [Limnothrix sp. FACHB-1083]|jgi:hypothetical protein|uniref:hypothetical protein n=1 Tax=unclassified Limnothrix TaxID=2632864 RepID=UPI0016809344|nr:MULTISPECIES: hypothetical protein [unclassified Limnothrix]MBD2161718.1 hypothetical protein [Limnothrix sp. FACHB-1083]MBD2192705.1 hypothetical protein [Limnothrix sp. FACHB-1088]
METLEDIKLLLEVTAALAALSQTFPVAAMLAGSAAIAWLVFPGLKRSRDKK